MTETEGGFTLIEMMMVLSILALLSAIALPMMNDFFIRHQDKLLQAQLLQTLEFAREESRIRRQPVAVCKSNAPATCSGNWIDGHLVFINKKEDGTVPAKKQIIAVIQNKSQPGVIHWRSFPVYRDYLLFLPTGLMSNDNGTFWYCHRANESPVWAIILSKSGKTRSLSPDKNGVIKDSHGARLVCAV